MNIQKALKKSLLLTATITFFVACTNPGKEIKINGNNKVYIKEGATDENAKQLGDYLMKVNYFPNDGKERAVQIRKESNKYIVSFVVDTAYYKQHSEVAEVFKSYEADISNVFGGTPVEVKAVDPALKEIKH